MTIHLNRFYRSIYKERIDKSLTNESKALTAVVINLVLIQAIRRESVNKEERRGERNGSDTPAH